MPKDFYDLRYMFFEETELEAKRREIIKEETEEKLSELREQIKILQEKENALNEMLSYVETSRLLHKRKEEKEYAPHDKRLSNDSGKP